MGQELVDDLVGNDDHFLVGAILDRVLHEHRDRLDAGCPRLGVGGVDELGGGDEHPRHAPTLKISANPASRSNLIEQLDFDASPVFRGVSTLAAASDALYKLLTEVASGQSTWGEVLKEGDEVVSRFGAAL